jgi:hypothetical protein
MPTALLRLLRINRKPDSMKFARLKQPANCQKPEMIPFPSEFRTVV